MTMNLENFILELDEFLTKEECDRFIAAFEMNKSLGFCYSRGESQQANKHGVDDHQFFSESYIESAYDINKQIEKNSPEEMIIKSTSDIIKNFGDIFYEKAYNVYFTKFSILKTSPKHYIRYTKIQKTEIGEGYHSWHYESDDMKNSSRILTFIVYLNDVDEGGETEFLYYPRRVKPKTGKIILWPASFTHTHRGNPPLSGSKYIVTGWVEFV